MVPDHAHKHKILCVGVFSNSKNEPSNCKRLEYVARVLASLSVLCLTRCFTAKKT